MYQENELKKLYERLKAQYPQYQLEFSGDSLTLNRLYCKVEVNQSGVKIYVNGNLYDQFTSEYVDDLDDLYGHKYRRHHHAAHGSVLCLRVYLRRASPVQPAH